MDVPETELHECAADDAVRRAADDVAADDVLLFAFLFPSPRCGARCSPVMHLRLSVPAVPACVTTDVFRVMYATVRASCVLLLTLLLLIVFESTRTSIMGELCLLCFNFNWRSHVAVTRCYNVFARVGGIKRGNDAFLSSCQRVLGHCKWLRTTS